MGKGLKKLRRDVYGGGYSTGPREEVTIGNTLLKGGSYPKMGIYFLAKLCATTIDLSRHAWKEVAVAVRVSIYAYIHICSPKSFLFFFLRKTYFSSYIHICIHRYVYLFRYVLSLHRQQIRACSFEKHRLAM